MALILPRLAVDLPSVHSKLYEVKVAAPPEEVWKFFSSVESLAALSPPNKRLTLLGNQHEVTDGVLHMVRVWLFGVFPVTWKARISQVTPPYGFTDQAEKSPFKFWRHRHDLIPCEGGTLVRDIVAYVVPLGKLGKALNRLFLSKDLDRMFEYRQMVLREKFGELQTSGTSSTH